jgi:hypothetical protein
LLIEHSVTVREKLQQRLQGKEKRRSGTSTPKSPVSDDSSALVQSGNCEHCPSESAERRNMLMSKLNERLRKKNLLPSMSAIGLLTTPDGASMSEVADSSSFASQAPLSGSYDVRNADSAECRTLLVKKLSERHGVRPDGSRTPTRRPSCSFCDSFAHSVAPTGASSPMKANAPAPAPPQQSSFLHVLAELASRERETISTSSPVCADGNSPILSTACAQSLPSIFDDAVNAGQRLPIPLFPPHLLKHSFLPLPSDLFVGNVPYLHPIQVPGGMFLPVAELRPSDTAEEEPSSKRRAVEGVAGSPLPLPLSALIPSAASLAAMAAVKEEAENDEII